MHPELTAPAQASASAAPRVALVGYGHWGPNLARVLARMGLLRAIYEPCDQARAKAQAAHPSILCQAAWSPVASRGELDAIVLATPAATHAALAEPAMQQGLDVFVEKPLATEPQAAQALVRAAKRFGRVLMVGHVLCYHPAVQKMAHMCHSGQLGPLRQLLATRHNFGIIRAHEDVVFSLGPHDVAVMLYLSGRCPTHVTAQGQAFLHPARLDACQLQLHFDQNLIGRISLSWLHPGKTQQLVVQGTEAALVFDDVQKRLEHVAMAIGTNGHGQALAIPTPAKPEPYAQKEPLAQELAAFQEAIVSRRQPVTSGAQGQLVVRILAAAQQSVAQKGRPIPLG